MTTASFTPCPTCPTQDGCGFMGRCLDREAQPAAVRWACRDCDDWPTCERKGKCLGLARRYIAVQEADLAARRAGMRLVPPDTPVLAEKPRAAVLREAERIVSRDRNAAHGEPEDSFARTAALWAAYCGVSFNAADVAAMLALLKLARLAHNPGHRDSWVDLAGYAACGAEVACNAPKMAQSGPLSGGVACDGPRAPETQEAR